MGSPGGHTIWYLGTHPRTKKRGKGMIFVRDWWGPRTSKGGVFSQKRVGVKGTCLTEDTPVTRIKGCSGKNTYILIFNTHFP